MSKASERTIAKQLRDAIASIREGPDKKTVEGLVQGCLLVYPPNGNLERIPYVIFGPIPEFAGGEFMGFLSFPPSYPAMPPDFTMTTPNGVFEINSGTPCVSIGKFHSNSYKRATGLNGFIMSIYGIYTAPDTLGAGIRVIYRKGRTQEVSENSIEYNRKNHPEILEALREVYPDYDLRRAVMHMSALGKTPQEIHEAALKDDSKFFEPACAHGSITAEAIIASLKDMPIRPEKAAPAPTMASRRRARARAPPTPASEPSAGAEVSSFDDLFDSV
jgi:ubiquitin-protein ligase